MQPIIKKRKSVYTSIHVKRYEGNVFGLGEGGDFNHKSLIE